jgi:phosphate transport system protein
MMEDPGNISSCAHLLFCSKNVERIGDHSTNIAESAIFLATGTNLPVDRPKVGGDIDPGTEAAGGPISDERGA